MKSEIMLYRMLHACTAGVFHVLFHYRLRRLIAMLKADYLWRVHGIAGVADLVYHSHADVIPDLLRNYGAVIGTHFFCKSQLRIEASVYGRLRDFSHLTMGDHVSLTKGIYLDLSDRIVMEDHVILSPEVKLLTHASVADKPLRHYFPDKFAPLTLSRGCWIGAGATILAGTRIGRYAVVAAGSVVIKDVPDLMVVGGVPAKVIRELPCAPPAMDGQRH